MVDRTSAEIAHVEVTQADRDLLISLFRLTAGGNAAAKINRGLTFTGEVEEIAAYRIACMKAMQEACSRICHIEQYNPAPYTAIKHGIAAIDPASVEVKP